MATSDLLFEIGTEELPSWYVSQGSAALAELLQQQERYMTQRNCYLAFTTSGAGTATATAP